MKTPIYLGIAVSLVLGAGFLVKLAARDNESPVNEWLQDQQKGYVGCTSKSADGRDERIRLFAVSDWKIVIAPTDVKNGTYRVLVHHATKGGIPIVSLLIVEVKKGQIHSIERDGGW